MVMMVCCVVILASTAAAQGPDGTALGPLNMRIGPGWDFDIAAILAPRTTLIFEAASVDGKWLLGTTQDGIYRGWISASLVRFSDGFDPASLVTSDEVIGTVDAGAAMVLEGEGVPATVISPVNLRLGPGPDYALVAQIAAQTPVMIDAENEQTGWLLVHTDQYRLRGWVTPDYVVRIENLPEGYVPPDSATMERLWQTPAVAQMTPTALEIYQRGLIRGNHPDRFSKVGDCQNVNSHFLGIFDRGEYTLGDKYADLQATIDHFAGSWDRFSMSVQSGFNVYAVTDPIWVDPAYCYTRESPMACEYRQWQPSFVIISLEVWYGLPEEYDMYMREILDFWIGQDVVPILATKSNNMEGDWSFNQVIARLAWEYDIPLWNLLVATDPLPDHGLVDSFHLSYAGSRFDDPEAMQMGWPWRNLTALQSLDAVWRGVTE